MFLKNDNKNNFNKYKLPLIILISILFLIGIIFLVIKLVNNKEIAYEERLYYINLIGEPTITLYQGDTYTELGYLAEDDSGKDVTNDVAVTSNIDTNNIGNYKVTYTLGNVTKERIVKVIAKPVGATYIHLYGDINTYLYVGETYQEKGYEVVDTVDGSNLNSQVKVNSNVNTSKEGIYKVTYSVTNSGGVTTTQERTVIVMDRSLSLLPNITDLTNQNVTINIYAKDELFSYLILPNNNKVTERISTYEVNSNGTYKFVMYNTKGEKSEKEVEITNIDKTKPSGSCSGYYKNNTSYITVNANDNVGISKYIINNTTYTTSNITINNTLTNVDVTIYDKAGNTVVASCNLENKDGSQPSSSPSSSSSKSSSSTAPASSSGNTPLTIKSGAHLEYYNGVKYYLVIPEGATTNMPLITYLSGGSGSYNNDTLKKTYPMKAVLDGSAYSYQKFIFLVPEYKQNNANSFKTTKALIEYIQETYKCNKNKNIITGVSSGAVATYWLGYHYPGFFSAVVPVSGIAWQNYNTNLTSSLPKKSDINLEAFTHAPIWSITGTADDYNNVMKEFTNMMNNKYPHAKALYSNDAKTFKAVIQSELGKSPSKMPGVSYFKHDTTILFYYVPELWEWMLRQ